MMNNTHGRNKAIIVGTLETTPFFKKHIIFLLMSLFFLSSQMVTFSAYAVEHAITTQLCILLTDKHDGSDSKGIFTRLTGVNGQTKDLILNNPSHDDFVKKQWSCFEFPPHRIGNSKDIGFHTQAVIGMKSDFDDFCVTQIYSRRWKNWIPNGKNPDENILSTSQFGSPSIERCFGDYDGNSKKVISLATSSVQPKKLKASRPLAKWVQICDKSCNKTLEETVTNGESSEVIKSQETTTAISIAVEGGVDFPGGSVSTTVTSSLEKTLGEEFSRAVSTERSVTKTSIIAYSGEEMAKFNIDSVWQWVAESKLTTGRTVLIRTLHHTCRPDSQRPTYLPGSSEDVGSCRTEETSALDEARLKKVNLEVSLLEQKFNNNQAQQPTQIPTQARRFSISITSKFARGMPDNPQAACEIENEEFLFFQGNNVWVYDNNTGEIDEPMAVSAVGLPDNIDACVNGDNGKLYFFKGTQYWRYDISQDAIEADYPQAISAGWAGLPNFITAAARNGNNQLMFISGDTIYDWDMTSNTMMTGVRSMRRDLSERLGNTNAAFRINRKTLFFGGGQMFNPQLY